MFLSTKADIAIYGGAAGGGKSYALLLKPLSHIHVSGFNAVIFRRNTTDLRNPGGLWDESHQIYPYAGGRSKEAPDMEWKFGRGQVKIQFSHLQYDKTVLDWQGAQVCMFGFDELSHFCCDPTHDVLTTRGWVPIAEVRKGDYVLSQVGSDNQSEFRRVLDTPSFDYSGDMIDIYQRNGISTTVTPNHRMVVRCQHDKKEIFRFERADAFEKRRYSVPRKAVIDRPDYTDPVKFEFPVGRGFGPNQNSAAEIDRDLWLEFLGWWLSEGYAANKVVGLAQTKPAPELDSMVRKLPWRHSPDGRGGWKIFSQQLSRVLKPMGDTYTKRVPRWVIEKCSPRQMKILFDSFMLGDGCQRGTADGYVSGLANWGLRDDIQEIATLIGRVTTTADYQVDLEGKKFDAYSVTVSSSARSDTGVRPHNVKRVHYEGKVHCLTVDCPPVKDASGNVVAPGGNFFVRHRGRTHFTGNSDKQWWYMLSRNRSTCGIKPYIRATTNPDADSWVAELIAWWINQDTGYPIPERAGVIRYFIRVGESLVWANDPSELSEYKKSDGTPIPPKSLTFIPAGLEDNKILMETDPDYEANLLAMNTVERERYRYGNWKIRPRSGMYFDRAWVEHRMVDAPPRCIKIVRGWDLAATEEREGTNPDWTCGTKIGMLPDQSFVVLDHVWARKNPGGVEELIHDTALRDGPGVLQAFPQDPAQAGKAQKAAIMKKLKGFNARFKTARGDKLVRFSPFSAQAQHGNVAVLRGRWNDRWFRELENFPPDPSGNGHDDDADSTSEAYDALTRSHSNRLVVGSYGVR